MNTGIRFSAAMLLAACAASAMMIEGQQMSMDDAIMKAGKDGEMSGMFEIMQGKDEDGREMVMVEMDMKYPMETYNKMREEMTAAEDEEGGARKKRKAILGSTYRWPNARVPYVISSTFSANDRALIMQAINAYTRYSCIRFVPAASTDRNYVNFQNGGGCSSYVGRIGGRQPISLAPGCRYVGIIIHEMGHAIGFQHEQTRPDRNGFVYINTGNIQAGVEYNFMQYSANQVGSFNIPYDYTSVMHYSQYAFSRNGQPTIVARDTRFQGAMGNRDGLSFKDIALANSIYTCAAANNCAARTCPTGAFQGQDCQCYCDSGNRANPIQVCNGQSVTTPRPSATTTTTAAPSNCEDRNTYCPRWASAGYCTGTYVTYMMTNCQASCNYCSMTTTTTTTMPTPPMPNCSDNNRYCSYWAARGECSNNPSYMNRNCARSCNTCEGGESDCRDMNSNCPNWTSYCTNNVYRDYLERNCMLSCNVCTANDETSAAPSSTTARPSSNCKNMMGDKYCEKSARKCATRPSFRRRCQKTCGSCRA